MNRQRIVVAVLGLALAAAAPVVQAEVVYQNNDVLTRGFDHGFGSPGNEGGDQITLGGSCRVITQLELAHIAGPGTIDLIVRLYANDGPVSPDAAAGNEPGTLLWDSGSLPITGTASAQSGGFQIFTVTVPDVTVPDTFTWTIERADGATISLPRVGPPTIGSSSSFIWAQFPTNWSPNQFASVPVNSFYAVVTAAGGAPEITCPPTATVECGASTNPSATGLATAANSCTGATVGTTFGDVSSAGPGGTETITRTWTATDPSGITCDQIITVVDTTNPTLSGVPADTSAECDAVPPPASPTVSDTCDTSPTLTYAETLAIGACLDQVTRTRTWTGTDANNNAVTQSQVILVNDTVPPAVTCPADVALSGGFGGANVTFATTAADNCDPAAGVATSVASGSFFNTGATTVTATAMDRCSNSASCSFDVLVSCFGVNRAKIGTKDAACRGIEEIEFTSMDGTEELISLFKAEEGSGGAEEDTLPPSIVVDDGVNGPVTVDTSCGQAIHIGDVFGPYVVTDIDADYDEHAEAHGNEVELKGSFVPAVGFDVAMDDMVFTIDDGQGHAAAFTIPAGSFQVDGKPEKGKLKFEGQVGVADVKVKLEGCKFKFKAKNALNTGQLVGTSMTVTLAVGSNVGTDTLAMEDKGNHLKFKRAPKINCCPECVGVASMQVTSDQGVLVFVPAAGQSELSANTVVDDGVNGSVTVHTSCSQAIEAGMVVGPYTISEVIKIFAQGD